MQRADIVQKMMTRLESERKEIREKYDSRHTLSGYVNGAGRSINAVTAAVAAPVGTASATMLSINPIPNNPQASKDLSALVVGGALLWGLRSANKKIKANILQEANNHLEQIKTTLIAEAREKFAERNIELLKVLDPNNPKSVTTYFQEIKGDAISLEKIIDDINRDVNGDEAELEQAEKKAWCSIL